MAYRPIPTGVAQDKVLQALGLTATDFADANRIFKEIGIQVTPKRVGRTSEPVITMLPTEIGGWNPGGDGESVTIRYKEIDLSRVAHFLAD